MKSNLQNEKISRIYALGLYEVACEKNKTEVFANELSLVSEILKKSNDLFFLLQSFLISKVEKKTIVKQILENKIDDDVLNFLFILIDKNRNNYIIEIEREYKKIIEEKEFVYSGEIYSVSKLTEEKIKKFEKDIEGLLKKKYKLKNIVDENLIAGVKILVDGKIIDASLKAGLSNMKIALNKKIA